ncbi:MAG TPA: DVUA0089 family protein [Phycisphaerales bacterium]|nr:DVUA0089 family protein [Phycisphaerales bacterium]
MRTPTVVAGLALALASAAYAQPVPIELGDISAAPTTSWSYGVSSGTLAWFSFTVPEVSRCAPTYLDIYTENFGGFDSEIAIYDSTGRRLFNDDDDGAGHNSAMSFGSSTPVRSYSNGGTVGDGRDGPLPAGTYYVVATPFNSYFLDTDWNVIPDAEGNQGGGQIVFQWGSGDGIEPPAGVAYESYCAGDAGHSIATAATDLRGSGALTEIRGYTQYREDIDIYKICITDAANFSADTFLSLQMDTQLYLFDANGRGVTLNDDIVESVQSRITSSVVAALGNGEYYIAVTPSSCRPQDASGQNLWGDTASGERLADGPGAANPLAQWESFVVNDNTWYILRLTGASFCENGPVCGPQDFNGDGDSGTDQDIEAFFACLGGSCCPTCWSGGADFNGDGDTGTDQDIEAFFRVLGGNPC